MNFFWGLYGLTELSSWEDIDLYDTNEEDSSNVCAFCICSKEHFRYHIEEAKQECSEDDLMEMEWIKSVEYFLLGKDIKYYYCYNDPHDEEFYQVPFEAKRNKNNVKPSYIEMWYPSEELSKESIEDAVKQFYMKFYKQDITVEMKEMITFEDALASYDEDKEFINGGREIIFSEELIAEIAEKTGQTVEEVTLLLERSIH